MLMGIPARRFAWILLIGSFLLRLAAVLALRDPTQFHGPEMGLDAYHYDELARNLVDGNGYTIGEQPTAFRPPGFPFFLAFVYALSAKSYLAAYLGLCLLGALAVYWTWRAASKLTDEHTARIAALLLAVYPPHLYFATIFATENLFVGLLALCLMLATRLREGSWRLQLGFGLCLGAMVLTRPFALLAVPLLLLPLLRSRTEWRRAALLLAGLALLLVPWTLRNSRALGHPVLLTTSSGAVLWGSSNDRVLNEERFRGGWVASEQLPGWEQVRAIPDERERDALQAQWGRAWLREHVRDVPKLLWWRLERFCMPDRDSDNGTYVLLQWLGTTPFLVLFGIGILWRIRFQGRGGAWWFADALMLACLATALMFYGAPRFRDGNAPILVLYAALPLAALLRRISPCEPDASSCGSTRAGSPRAP